MKITKFEIHGFKPLLHGGIAGIKLDVVSDTMCILGNNGSGKSKMMFEMHPFPATSSDYISGGFKELHFVHGACSYVTRSEFNGKSINHSFIRNGDEELNQSGTSGVQNELCETILGLNDAVKALLKGNVRLSKMLVTERKKFLMSCYPSDLTFVLDHHKRLSSAVRGVKANVKMLRERQAGLESEAIPEEAYELMCQRLDHLTSYKTSLGELIALYRHELEHTVSLPTYDPSAPEINIAKLQQEIRALCVDASTHQRKVKTYDPDGVQSIAHEKEMRVREITTEQNSVSDEIVELVAEINRFEQLSKEMADDQLIKQRDRIGVLKDNIAKLIVDDKMPSVSADIAKALNITKLHELIMSVVNSESPMISSLEYSKMEGRLGETVNAKNDLYREQQILRHNIGQNKKDLEGFSNTFRKECDLKCPAREQSDRHRASMEKSLKDNLVAYDKVTEEHDRVDSELSRISAIVKGNAELHRAFRDIKQMVDGFIPVLDFEDLEKAFIDNPLAVYNQILAIQTNSISKNDRIAHQQELEREEQMLSSLEASRKEKQDMLDEFSGDKIDRVSRLKQHHAELKLGKEMALSSFNKYNDLLQDVSKLGEMEGYVTQTLEVFFTNGKVEWLSNVLNKLEEIKKTLEKDIIDINTTIKSQAAIRIRIEQEVLPNLKAHEKDLERLETLAWSLSPVDGLPHVYMVRFMNEVIKHANISIRKVWNYGMSVATLKETARMDYLFKVNIFSNSTLKDIAILSTAQSEMVDAAMVLGLYRVMGIGAQLPLKLDEVDSGMTPHHRTKLMGLISEIANSDKFGQLFIINHHASLFTGLPQAQICVLNGDGIVVPDGANKDVEIIRG